ncbi:stringent starvation protein A [beta proteobacterium KB13]|uniref:Stringent starvation protein A n=1 Tax=beta proteobacterium KB13 TaxID=314607 RepID=B6BV93_9PROT|nr:stringent starvation protein A [beta proteobacterium KB13]
MDNKPDELTTLSPYVDSPVLIERNLVLTDPNIINEYIDERFPHPQLMPPDPIMRARARLFLKDFENQLFIHMPDVEGADTAKKNKALKTITEGLLQLVPILNKQPYLLYDEYSMLDVAMAPLLWRLDHYGIKLPASAKPLMKYADSLFNRPLFDEAMTPAEKAMR